MKRSEMRRVATLSIHHVQRHHYITRIGASGNVDPQPLGAVTGYCNTGIHYKRPRSEHVDCWSISSRVDVWVPKKGVV